jgi:acyl-coenzyme A synthetase/AMP-(fatty) acid ligase
MAPGVAQDRLEPLTWSDQSLWQQFAELCAADPSALALVDGDDRSWSRAELRDMATTLAKRLHSLGVGPADRLLVTARQSGETFAAALATSQVGAIFCPCSPTLGSADADLIEANLGHVASIRAVFSGESQVCVRDRAQRSHDVRDAATVLIGFTSGTTGVPKAVMHGASALNYVTRACAATAGLVAGESILGLMPLDSAAGFTFTAHFSLALGHPVVFMARWNAVEAMARVQRYGCRWTTLVPTHLFAMVEAARAGSWRAPLPLRAISVGGSSMTPDLIEDTAELLGVPALRMFGMSECLAHCSNRLEHTHAQRDSFDGIPFAGSEVEAFDAAQLQLPRGEGIGRRSGTHDQ